MPRRRHAGRVVAVCFAIVLGWSAIWLFSLHSMAYYPPDDNGKQDEELVTTPGRRHLGVVHGPHFVEQPVSQPVKSKNRTKESLPSSDRVASILTGMVGSEDPRTTPPTPSPPREQPAFTHSPTPLADREEPGSESSPLHETASPTVDIAPPSPTVSASAAPHTPTASPRPTSSPTPTSYVSPTPTPLSDEHQRLSRLWPHTWRLDRPYLRSEARVAEERTLAAARKSEPFIGPIESADMREGSGAGVNDTIVVLAANYPSNFPRELKTVPRCPALRCYYTSDVAYLRHADAVLWHVPLVEGLTDHRPRPLPFPHKMPSRSTIRKQVVWPLGYGTERASSPTSAAGTQGTVDESDSAESHDRRIERIRDHVRERVTFINPLLIKDEETFVGEGGKTEKEGQLQREPSAASTGDQKATKRKAGGAGEGIMNPASSDSKSKASASASTSAAQRRLLSAAAPDHVNSPPPPVRQPSRADLGDASVASSTRTQAKADPDTGAHDEDVATDLLLNQPASASDEETTEAPAKDVTVNDETVVATGGKIQHQTATETSGVSAADKGKPGSTVKEADRITPASKAKASGAPHDSNDQSGPEETPAIAADESSGTASKPVSVSSDVSNPSKMREKMEAVPTVAQSSEPKPRTYRPLHASVEQLFALMVPAGSNPLNNVAFLKGSGTPQSVSPTAKDAKSSKSSSEAQLLDDIEAQSVDESPLLHAVRTHGATTGTATLSDFDFVLQYVVGSKHSKPKTERALVAAFFASGCSAEPTVRDKYHEALTKWISADSYGSCTTEEGEPTSADVGMVHKLQHYKFTLVFEDDLPSELVQPKEDPGIQIAAPHGDALDTHQPKDAAQPMDDNDDAYGRGGEARRSPTRRALLSVLKRPKPPDLSTVDDGKKPSEATPGKGEEWSDDSSPTPKPQTPVAVSSRFFQALAAGSIPVYLGLGDPSTIAPHPTAYIDAKDFETPRHLAEYLIKLDRNDQLYASYSRWRVHEDSDPEAQCRLCFEIARAQRQILFAARPVGQRTGKTREEENAKEPWYPTPF